MRCRCGVLLERLDGEMIARVADTQSTSEFYLIGKPGVTVEPGRHVLGYWNESREHYILSWWETDHAEQA